MNNAPQNNDPLRFYKEIWFVDTEYKSDPGEYPDVHCLVAKEHRTGHILRLWKDQLKSLNRAPFDIGSGSLFVSFYAPAELSCFLELGWPLPERILDVYVEHRREANYCDMPPGKKFSLLGALRFHRIPYDDNEESYKDSMRRVAIRGGPFSSEEKIDLVNYCQSDVELLRKLFLCMVPDIDFPSALLRGRYLGAVAHMERTGIPIDVPTLEQLRTHWKYVKEQLIAQTDVAKELYEGITFKHDRFNEWLLERGIPWPVTNTGRLSTSVDTFADMAKVFPEVNPIKEIKHTLGQMNLEDLEVGKDSRNRCMLSPFKSRTSRNQPSNKKFIFGPSTWMRSLIKPEPGRAIAYIDYSQQEFAIAAALSKDSSMMEAYLSGDPYMAFAIQAGAAPVGATKKSHAGIRSKFKQCVLAINYGMGYNSLAEKIQQSPVASFQLIRAHKETYPTFWAWQERAIDHLILIGHIDTCLGWRLYSGIDPNPRSVGNWPVQTTGSHVLQVACCYLTEAGIETHCPVHDAVLIGGPSRSIEAVVAQAQELMGKASRDVLGGFEIRTDAEIFKAPERYSDERGAWLWERIVSILDQAPGGNSKRQNVLAGCDRSYTGCFL